MTESSAGQLNQKGNRRGMSPKSLANLRPSPAWQPGKSGNPKGGPCKGCLCDLMAEGICGTESDRAY